ncbi:MAG: DNA/RNA-binding domain of Phe-tRNA-synthetase-like protein [Polaribacter sp.]|jgi:DNA/RNA-binding domain of Phe-tRNA-synthetase-like protein
MINISSEIKNCCPNLQVGVLTCSVEVKPTAGKLADLISERLEKIQSTLEIPQISQLPMAQQTRRGYKATGKDPARYRPAAESLLRRVVQGKGLYQINNVVDALNLTSAETAYSIGGYDMDAIKGEITLGIGKAAEPYQGIGRGDLNIEGLATFRDEVGAFGTPTSDSARTSVQESTKRFMMLFYDFEGSGLLEGVLKETKRRYEEYVDAKDIDISIL